MNVYALIILLCACFPIIKSQNCKNEPKCKISRIHGMKGADCYSKNMRQFPQCLPSNVEIIDLSLNRVRKLSKNDLKKYTELRILYLHDNLIVSIDEDVFNEKDDLNTIDLSLNAISKLPVVVFHLPSLKSLYLGQNLNINIAEIVEKAKPVTSPLIHLDISFVMSEEPNYLPEFEILPLFTKYNISGNKLISVSTKHFAGLCNLKILDTQNVTVEYDSPCDCWTLNNWLKNRKVQFAPFECSTDENECQNTDEVPVEDLQLYNRCKREIADIIEKTKLMKILIPIGVIAFLAALGGTWYCVRKKRSQNQLRNKQRLEEPIIKHAML